jgi:stress response protein YsnF
MKTIKRNCDFCSNFVHQEIGDSDFGATYEDVPSCSEYHDLNDNDEFIEDFDREIERSCCVLDFFSVIEFDTELEEAFNKEMRIGHMQLNETYELFEKKYLKINK